MSLLTAAETAIRRRRTPQALASERARGEGPPYIRDGGRILYDENELDRWERLHRVDPALTPRPRRSAVKSKPTQAEAGT